MDTRVRHTFHKSERLCSKKLIDEVFERGNAFHTGMFRIVWLPAPANIPSPAQVVLVVPKKNIRSAIRRNLIRRRIREAYRKNKQMLYDLLKGTGMRLAFAIIYSNQEPADYWKTEESVIEALRSLMRQIKQKNPNLVKE